MDFDLFFNDVIEFAQADTMHIMLLTGFLGLLALLIGNEISRMFRGFKEIPSAQVVALMNQQDATLVDVRETTEYNKSHIVNAINIPLSKLEKEVGKLDTSKPVITYCGVGHVGVKAATQLKKAGFKDLYALKGGIQTWQADNLPTVNAKKAATKTKAQNKANQNKGNNKKANKKNKPTANS